MTEDAYIAKVIHDNPIVMAAEKIQLTPAAMQQVLRAAWRSGKASGEDVEWPDLIGGMFGKVWDR